MFRRKKNLVVENGFYYQNLKKIFFRKLHFLEFQNQEMPSVNLRHLEWCFEKMAESRPPSIYAFQLLQHMLYPVQHMLDRGTSYVG